MQEELLDEHGRVLARYDRRTRLELPYAAELEPVEATTGELVDALFRARSGWVFSAAPEICLEARSRGGTVIRHGHGYTYDLRTQPVPTERSVGELAEGLRFSEFTVGVEEIFPAYQRAFPPGHVDHGMDEEVERRDFGRLLAGEVLGPLLPCSGLVWDGDAVVAVAIITDRPGEPPMFGPWVAQVYRDPEPRYRGLGAALLRRSLALAARDGLPAIGLAVTEGNPARAVYEKLGFRHVDESMTVLIPA